jgi:2-dehydropantoate 2-reductase
MIEASVLVVGGGAIGGITAAKLTGEVRRVVVLDSDEQHVERLRGPGLTFEEAGAEHTVALDAVSSAADLDGEFDFALIAVKSRFTAPPWSHSPPGGTSTRSSRSATA